MGRKSYLVAILGYGFFCQIGQAVLFRELFTIFQGNELSFGIILFTWLFWSGLGSRFSAKRIHRLPPYGYLSPALLTTLLLPLTIWGIRILRGLLPIPQGAQVSLLDIGWISFLFMGPLCFLLGGLFIRIAKAWRLEEQRLDTHTGGKAYFGESVGTAIGGLGFSLLLVRIADSSQIVTFAGLLFAGTLLYTFLPGASRNLLFLFCFLSVGAFILARHIDQATHALLWKLYAPEYQLLRYKSSRYGVLAIAQRELQLSVYQNSHLLFTMASPEASSSGFEEQAALVFAHFSLLQHKAPQTVLLIGGGLRGTLRGILSHPVQKVQYVELDPDLINLALPHVPEGTKMTLRDPRVELLIGDGRLHLRTTSHTFDLVILDIPDPTTAALNRFFTYEFFSLVSNRLNPGGVLALRTSSTPELRLGAMANKNATLYHTLREVFPQVLAVGEHTLYLFASSSPGNITSEPRVLIHRFQERGISEGEFSPYLFEQVLLEGPLLRTNWILNRHGRAPLSLHTPPERGPLILPPLEEQRMDPALQEPLQKRYFINSDVRPIGYFHSVHVWSSLTRSDHSPLLALLLYVQPQWLLPFLGISLLITLILRRFAYRNPRLPMGWAIRFSVFTTGLSTMSMQVALLFAFQTTYGVVYEMVGLIIALFMIGLALGTFLTETYIRKKDALGTLALLQLLLGSFAGIIGLGLLKITEIPQFLGFAVLTVLSGVLNGADFPVAIACLASLEGTVDRAIGTVYGIELGGACAGCLVAGVLIAPILGLDACFWLASIANLTAFVIVLLTKGGGALHG